MTSRVLFTVAAVALAAAGSASESADVITRKFIGTWRLVSTEQRLADGTRRASPIYGDHGVGYLIYTDAKHMCAVLMDPTRPLWKSEDSPTEQELKTSFEHYVAYCGKYEVHPSEGYVIHHVELDMVPNSVGSELKRMFWFEGERLVLRPSEPLAKGLVEYKLTWERVKQ
jgi:hypothetical protein